MGRRRRALRAPKDFLAADLPQIGGRFLFLRGGGKAGGRGGVIFGFAGRKNGFAGWPPGLPLIARIGQGREGLGTLSVRKFSQSRG